MLVGSNQPYLLPYLAYWQLMNRVDYYVISDNMNFIRHGYINRNYILSEGKRSLFTLEVLGVHQDTPINQVDVGRNRKKILRTIASIYQKAPYFKKTFPIMEDIFTNEEKNLAIFLGHSIKKIAHFLEMDTKFIYLSDLQGETPLKAQARTIDICKRLNADHYINAIGGQELYNRDDFAKEEIKLSFLKMDAIEYKQFENDFIPDLSILDVMMFNSKDEIKKMLGNYSLV